METANDVDAALSAAYRLGEKTVVKGGYGLFYDTLNAADYGAVRNGQRFDQPFEDTLRVDAGAGSALNTQNQNHEHTRLQRWRFGIQREVARNLSVEIAYDGSYADRREISIRQDYLPEQYWITGSRNNAAQAAVVANAANPYRITNFETLRTTNPVLYQRRTLQARFDIQNLLNYAGVRQSGDRPDEHELRQGRLGGFGRRRDAVLQLRFAVYVLRQLRWLSQRPGRLTPSWPLYAGRDNAAAHLRSPSGQIEEHNVRLFACSIEDDFATVRRDVEITDDKPRAERG